MSKSKSKMTNEALEFTAGFASNMYDSTQDEAHVLGMSKSALRAYLSALKSFSKAEIDAKVDSFRM